MIPIGRSIPPLSGSQSNLEPLSPLDSPNGSPSSPSPPPLVSNHFGFASAASQSQLQTSGLADAATAWSRRRSSLDTLLAHLKFVGQFPQRVISDLSQSQANLTRFGSDHSLSSRSGSLNDIQVSPAVNPTFSQLENAKTAQRGPVTSPGNTKFSNAEAFLSLI